MSALENVKIERNTNKSKAIEMITHRGYSQKEVALELHVSEKSVGKWVKNSPLVSINPRCAKTAAKRALTPLLVKRGYSQKQISGILGTSEKTVGKWVVENEFSKDVSTHSTTLEGDVILSALFMQFVKDF